MVTLVIGAITSWLSYYTSSTANLYMSSNSSICLSSISCMYSADALLLLLALLALFSSKNEVHEDVEEDLRRIRGNHLVGDKMMVDVSSEMVLLGCWWWWHPHEQHDASCCCLLLWLLLNKRDVNEGILSFGILYLQVRLRDERRRNFKRKCGMYLYDLFPTLLVPQSIDLSPHLSLLTPCSDLLKLTPLVTTIVSLCYHANKIQLKHLYLPYNF